MLLKLFRTSHNSPPFSRLEGKRVYIRTPERRDGPQWIDVRTRNHAFLLPWSPTRAMANITKEGYLTRLATYQEDWKADRSYAFFVFLQDGALIGGLTLNNIVRGAAQMTHLGYWLDEAHTRQGYMTEAVRLACGFAFTALKLHRVEAGTLPENHASQKVLTNCGFMVDGFRRKYLKIAGEWRDHLIFSLLAEEFAAQGQSPRP
jgi:[ribosomal protein S5]-alanine N-acetyltransferase